MRSSFWLAGVALMMPAAAMAKDAGADTGFDLSGSFRAQVEAIDGQFRPKGGESDQLLTLRTIVAASYDTGPVRIGAELWDARAYFAEPDSTLSTAQVNALELVQAYVGFDLQDGGKGAAKTTLDLGRMTLDLGSRRLVSRQNFRNTTNAYTGAHLHHEGTRGDRLDAIWVMPQERLPRDREDLRNNVVEIDRETSDLQLFGASYEAPVGLNGARLEAYAYRLAEQDSPGHVTAQRKLVTPGIRFYREPKAGKLDFEVEAMAQGGDILQAGRTVPVSAWALHAGLGYRFDAPWSPRLAFVYDQGSGEDGDRHYSRFDSLFGARRFDYGPTSLYGPVSRSNSISPGVRLEVKPDKRWDGFLAHRVLWLASATDSFGSTGVKDPTGRSGRYAGQQLEGRVRYWAIPGKVQLDTGFAVLFKGRFLRDAPNAPDTGDTHYGYFGITTKF